MEENKKIKNTKKIEVDGIKFKSLLEGTVYKTLIENGLKPKYEEQTFLLFEGFIPKTPFYTKNKFKRKNRHIIPDGIYGVQDKRSLNGITYTPDFIFDYHGTTVIVEVKGLENDVFPYKFKMFRKYIDDHFEGKVEIWEIFNKKQLIECINHLKKSR